jgi:hypothetical protein
LDGCRLWRADSTSRRVAPAGTVARTPRHGAAHGMGKLITLCVVGIAALAIVGGLFVAVCIESLIAPKDPS